MSLGDEERKIMVEFEIERAHRLIDQFPILENAKLWDTLANRMYYAVFHAVTALLIKNGLHAESHQGTSVLFSKHFVKEGLGCGIRKTFCPFGKHAREKRLYLPF